MARMPGKWKEAKANPKSARENPSDNSLLIVARHGQMVWRLQSQAPLPSPPSHMCGRINVCNCSFSGLRLKRMTAELGKGVELGGEPLRSHLKQYNLH